MKIEAYCKNTDEMEIEMTFTTTLHQWQRILEHIDGLPYFSPTADVQAAIRRVIGSMTQTFEGGQSLTN